MKCHYAVLGIQLSADDDQIKKAYRRLALKWHPDKNIENAEEATEQFRLIQAAYDVLSDPQEKAWYDKHRLEILHKSEFENFKDASSDLLEFFTPSAYRGFGNDAKGFYAVYRDVFRKVSEEDKKFCDDADSDDDVDLPGFGDVDSDYDAVVHPFYATWQSYCTKLTYVWVDKYDVHEAPDRRVARLIEKENKKERDKERKKRNELIRDLVRFVRKRDPRVRAHREELEEVALKNAAKAAEKRTQLLRARVEEAALYEQEHREKHLEHAGKVTELENMLKDEFGFSSSSEEEEERNEDASQDEEDGEDLYCVACNKQFKTSMAIKNHEKSKKHKEKLRKLQAEMQSEKEEEETSHQSMGANEEEPHQGLSNPPSPAPGDSDDYEEKIPNKKLSKKQKKRQQKMKSKLFNEPSEFQDFCDITQNEENRCHSNREAEPSVNDVKPNPDVNGSLVNENNYVGEESNSQPSHSVKKSKTKPGKKMNAKSATAGSVTSQKTNYCVTCDKEYHSRNKLFQHLKSSGHATLVNDIGGKSKKTKNR